jgi:hypothetical protein
VEVVYRLVPRKAGGKDVMQRPESEADKKGFERLFLKMGKDVDAMENLTGPEEYMEIMDRMRGRRSSINLNCNYLTTFNLEFYNFDLSAKLYPKITFRKSRTARAGRL